MNKILLLVLLLLAYVFPCELSAKVRILTFYYNRPEFVEYQSKACKKFLQEEHEIIVFNDAPDESLQKAIEAECKKYEIPCIRFEQAWHETDPLNEKIRQMLDTPEKNDFFRFPLTDGLPDLKAIYQQCSVRHCHVIQYALDHFGYNHDDIVVIMDADLFPIQPISIKELLTDVQVVGIDSEFRHLHYLWVPFIAFDPRNIPDLEDFKFHTDVVEGLMVDSGSHSYNYFKNHPEVTYRLIPRRTGHGLYPWNHKTLSRFGFSNPGMTSIAWPTMMEFYLDYRLVHYCGGSGLRHEQKWQTLFHFMQCVLDGFDG